MQARKEEKASVEVSAKANAEYTTEAKATNLNATFKMKISNVSI